MNNNDMNMNPNDIPELDSKTASELLNNVFAECQVPPNAIPLETLESWGNYRKTEFRLGRVISYTVLVILVLLPLMFFKPTIIAERTDVSSTENAVYNVEIKTLMPVDTVSATLNGNPVPVERIRSKHYVIALTENGELAISASTMNGQLSTKKYEVSHLDIDKPTLLQSYTADGNIYLVVSDPYSGINYDGITGVDGSGASIPPLAVDKNTETITFQIPTSPITVAIPDNAGNKLEILLSPAQ